jgi:hypothetical protein
MNPAPIAKTFLRAPANSTPTTSFWVYILKFILDKVDYTNLATSCDSLATTTIVGTI